LEDDIQNYETYLKNNTIYEITGQWNISKSIRRGMRKQGKING
jgi:hypothetical protein